MSTIIVTGYPYAFSNYRKVFEYTKQKDRYAFILPKIWRSKSIMHLPGGSGMYGVSAWSYGRYSLLGGPFKGFTPGIVILLFRMRFFGNAQVLYSCLEPNLFSTLYNGLCARLLGMRHIIFTWQNVPSKQRLHGLKLFLSDFIVKLNLLLANGVICGNTKAAEIIKKFKIQDSRFKILICPLSGVDTEVFRPGIANDWKRRLNIQKEAQIILFAGALGKRKGIDVLLRAFSKIKSKASPVLIIVGKGPDREKLERLAKELGILKNVRFLDWIENNELPSLMNCADVFAYPSIPYGGWEEQFGYSMAEASACGVPVVSTRTGSISEVVKTGETGILVPPDDVEQLSEALSSLLNDDNMRYAMGERGREFITQTFGHEEVAKKLDSFFKIFI